MHLVQTPNDDNKDQVEGNVDQTSGGGKGKDGGGKKAKDKAGTTKGKERDPRK